MFSTGFIALAVASFIGSAVSAPGDTTNATSTPPGESKRLIVTLKEGAVKPQSLGNPSIPMLEVINSFIVNSDDVSIEELRADPTVESVEEDGIATINVVQNDAPWGLARLSSKDKLVDQDSSHLTFDYKYSRRAGRGVDIYVVDTGVRTTHNEFGGRASWGATFGGYGDADGNGHGTHCAGTAAGEQYGVAKAANVIAVKVLSDSGSGFWSDVISGLNYVYTQHQTTKRPTIVSMSLGGSPNNAVDAAITNLIKAGVHVVVAAGNSNDDVANYSPGRVKGALTIGASDITDAKAFFSNYGSLIDVFAPGVNVISAWITNDSASNNISGTSMAAPHVSGLVAYIISIRGNKKPSKIAKIVRKWSEKNDLSGLPAGTANRLAHNSKH